MTVITISRKFGAGGKTLGEKVSKKLGKKDPDQPGFYHVALNTSKLFLENACRHICMLVQDEPQ